MSWYRKKKLESDIKFGNNKEIRESAKDLFDNSIGIDNKKESIEFIEEQLKKHKPFETRTFGNQTTYDGITIKKYPVLPELEIKDEFEEDDD